MSLCASRCALKAARARGARVKQNRNRSKNEWAGVNFFCQACYPMPEAGEAISTPEAIFARGRASYERGQFEAAAIDFRLVTESTSAWEAPLSLSHALVKLGSSAAEAVHEWPALMRTHPHCISLNSRVVLRGGGPALPVFGLGTGSPEDQPAVIAAALHAA